MATDRSETADRAVAWAVELAARFEAELLLLQVLPGDADGAAGAEESLGQLAAQLAGERGRARVDVHADAPRAIVEAAEQERADLLVVGNAGMSGRKEFLLGNVPNRVSHNARCTVVIVNTRDGATEVAAVRDEGQSDEVEGKLLGRAGHIGRVLAKYGLEEGLGLWKGDDGDARARAKKLREALEQLGPTFAKLGQILSTRPELLPPEFVEELATLQDHVTPLSESEVVAVMERELAVPWEDVFESIDAEPLAAGTIGQVHRATLEDGARVVVKVQRPTARTEIMRDLGLFELFAAKASARPALRQMIDIPALVEHLSSSLQRELDFRQEAANIERMREVLGPYERLDVPGLYAEYTTPRLLVMEEIQGVPIREAPEGDTRKGAARELLEAYYRQILKDGFFHADPHPGNLMWWNDRVYFLDFGMVGEIEPELRELMIVLLLAFWRDDPAFLAESMLMLAGEAQRADLDMEPLEQEFGAFIQRFRGQSSLAEIQIGPMIEGLGEIATRHGIRLPAALALSGKAFGQMQLAVAELDPELDPFSVITGFLMRALRERMREYADPQRVYYEGQKLKLRASRLLEAVERATGARPGPKLQLELIGTATIERAIRRAGVGLALAVTAGAVCAGGVAAWLAAELSRRR